MHSNEILNFELHIYMKSLPSRPNTLSLSMSQGVIEGLAIDTGVGHLKGLALSVLPNLDGESDGIYSLLILRMELSLSEFIRGQQTLLYSTTL